MPYFSNKKLESFKKLLDKYGYAIEFDDVKDIKDIELGLEREFDESLVYAMEDSSKKICVPFNQWSIEEDGCYRDVIEDLFSLVGKEITVSFLDSDFNNKKNTETVKFEFEGKEQEWEFSFNTFEEQKVMSKVRSMLDGKCTGVFLTAYDEDCTYKMYLPVEIAEFLNRELTIFEFDA